MLLVAHGITPQICTSVRPNTPGTSTAIDNSPLSVRRRPRVRTFRKAEFFTNASAWILARGARIASEVKKQLENKDLYGLARQMAG